MHRDRVERLIRFLEELDNEDFFLGTWVGEVENGLPKCGTVACALGWACSIPEFRALGLHFEYLAWEWVPYFDNDVCYMAAAKFFDIAINDAHIIFSPVHYSSRYVPKYEVIERLQRLLEKEVDLVQSRA